MGTDRGARPQRKPSPDVLARKVSETQVPGVGGQRKQGQPSLMERVKQANG